MTKGAVLAIGIEPGSADVKANPDLVRTYIETQIGRLRALGYDVTTCLIDLGEAAEAAVSAALTTKRFDCVVIGAGLRRPPSRLLLFERVINLVHSLAPQARICFNTVPADTPEAVLRWLE